MMWLGRGEEGINIHIKMHMIAAREELQPSHGGRVKKVCSCVFLFCFCQKLFVTSPFCVDLHEFIVIKAEKSTWGGMHEHVLSVVRIVVDVGDGGVGWWGGERGGGEEMCHHSNRSSMRIGVLAIRCRVVQRMATISVVVHR